MQTGIHVYGVNRTSPWEATHQVSGGDGKGIQIITGLLNNGREINQTLSPVEEPDIRYR